MAKISELSAQDFEKKIAVSKKPILVEFFASWCGACKTLEPVLKKFLTKKPDFEAFKVSVEKESKLAAKFHVMSLPTLLVFSEGKPTKQITGLFSEAELEKKLSQFY